MQLLKDALLVVNIVQRVQLGERPDQLQSQQHITISYLFQLILILLCLCYLEQVYEVIASSCCEIFDLRLVHANLPDFFMDGCWEVFIVCVIIYRSADDQSLVQHKGIEHDGRSLIDFLDEDVVEHMLHAFLGLLADVFDGFDVDRVIFESSPADEL